MKSGEWLQWRRDSQRTGRAEILLPCEDGVLRLVGDAAEQGVEAQ